MIYLYAIGAACALYYFRRFWVTPWARFVRHSSTKTAGDFLTVRHVRWYPPFLDFECTYHRGMGRNRHWVDVDSGRVPFGSREFGHEFHQLTLDGMLDAAWARQIETDEILAPEPKVKR